MVSFYPGPSRVHDDIPKYVAEAFRKGILSMNHRSDEFMDMARETVSLLKARLQVPADYEVYFGSSATECWEMIAQSLVRKGSVHLFSGSFGEKWFDYTKKIHPAARAITFDREALLAPTTTVTDGDLICLTQNETSNGTQVDVATIGAISAAHPQHLVAVDATSSMAGITLDFTAADVWFASVQKCFGMPAGLAVMICSPRAVHRIVEVGERSHYNSLLLVKEMMDKFQTSCTPNVLGIYLLMRVLKKSGPISKVDKETRRRAGAWEKLVDKGGRISYVVRNKAARSVTVLALTGEEDHMAELKARAKKKGFLLGEGYGAMKKSSFRIANFPALKNQEIGALMKFMKEFQ